MKLTSVIILSLGSTALAAPAGAFDKFCSKNRNQPDCFEDERQNWGIRDPTAEALEKDDPNDGARPISFEPITPKVTPDNDNEQGKCDCSKPFSMNADYDETDTDAERCPAGYEDLFAHLSIPNCVQAGCSESDFKAKCNRNPF
ncbi:hypothetical protein CRV24_004608 [Beauveria bassiana]|uniref:Uncharacterized protein n=1 Tax=Beauveria bassiana (strain ARSEF 2860) TaxID=655819 RepID=J5JES5_BEAB2|nr:uncharacterized protein BBA_06720 [Beauveria bassiana ARSEF 2860]EJP64338.1 hypothetical protein BBA_06720 [Beauveria bassiana ARSEF 2860]KAF1735682.1 hypothetical protein CRV24_004608 [Beauveria bassiana]KAH8711244.1 hypothetical protein HC256_008058 [Beauveria bassiana]